MTPKGFFNMLKKRILNLVKKLVINITLTDEKKGKQQ